MATARSVFYVSDGSGLTAEAFGRAMLAQFDGLALHAQRVGGVSTFEALYALVDRLRDARARDGVPPLVFATLVDAVHVQALKALDVVCIDLFEPALDRLADALQAPPTRRVRAARERLRSDEREARIAAIDFALVHDDGASAARLAEADVVLVGVSRSGKTPTCLYLAMQHGIRAANCPLTPDDFARGQLPAALRPVRAKLLGLSVSAERLAEVRGRRLPGSRYASPANCRDELAAAQRLMAREGIHCLDATTPSVEELAGAILAARSLAGRAPGQA